MLMTTTATKFASLQENCIYFAQKKREAGALLLLGCPVQRVEHGRNLVRKRQFGDDWHILLRWGPDLKKISYSVLKPIYTHRIG